MQRTAMLIGALLLSATALADDPPAKLDRMGPCKADVQKLCANVQPGGGRIVACLKQNKDNVSTQCKERLEQMRSRKNDNQSDTGHGQTGNNN